MKNQFDRINVRDDVKGADGREYGKVSYANSADTEGGRAYRGEIAKSSLSGSGSDQTRSAIGPSCGISGKTFIC